MKPERCSAKRFNNSGNHLNHQPSVSLYRHEKKKKSAFSCTCSRFIEVAYDPLKSMLALTGKVEHVTFWYL